MCSSTNCLTPSGLKRPRFNAASAAHIKGETEFYESLFRVQHRDESWLYILDRGKVVEKDARGKPTYFTGTHTDITKEKLAEQKAIEVSHAKSFFMASLSLEAIPLGASYGVSKKVLSIFFIEG